MRLLGFLWTIYYKCISNGNIKIGKNFSRRKCVDIHVSDGGKIIIGENVFFNKYCSVASKKLITIGDNSIFGESVKIYDSNHRFSSPEINICQQGFVKDSIAIGCDCWIGSNCVILKGCRIGNHSIIGAGCVVDFDIPDWTIVKCISSKLQIIERRH